MSFIITRSDLLAPTKEQADSIMPWLREVLREALGRVGRKVRLGNVRCVSAKRSWWTKTLKEEIWERGGAGWMVGKVNVGKSQLFEAVFPKGRMSSGQSKHKVTVDVFPRDSPSPAIEAASDKAEDDGWEDDLVKMGPLDDLAMLPPAQPETNYPAMPTVSSLPGTTASPIRIPFGNGKGELIDLPGLARSDLELFVKPEHRESLIMTQRIVPEQHSIKPGQSLLLGGLVRITPRTPDLIFLAYNFTPLKEHLTATDKSIGFQEQTREDKLGVTGNIALPETGAKMQLAGSVSLRHDVTRQRAGPLTRKDAIKLKVEQLPFRVLAVDLLIEGCGWVEIVAQVRTKTLYQKREEAKVKELSSPVPEMARDAWEEMELSTEDRKASAKSESESRRPRSEPEAEAEPEPELNWPVVDVYTPEGRFVDARMPMNAWLLNRKRVQDKHLKSRPRKSMKGAKKQEKLMRRAAEGAM